MNITREQTAEKLRAYLEHDLPLDSLVDWAESAMNDGQFSDVHHDAIRDVVARLGVADVRAFGLAWEDCEQLLRKLGYTARVSIASV